MIRDDNSTLISLFTFSSSTFNNHVAKFCACREYSDCSSKLCYVKSLMLIMRCIMMTLFQNEVLEIVAEIIWARDACNITDKHYWKSFIIMLILKYNNLK